MSGSVAVAAEAISVELGGVEILHQVSLHADRGEVVALVGPNGAGKSTLLAVISGDITPTSGQLWLDGRRVEEYSAREAARERAVMVQDQQLAFGFRGREVVEMGRTPWYRTPQAARDVEAVDEAMTRGQVWEFAQRLFPSLSGGERARVAYARTLAQETPIVLLDEPTAALDIRHQEQVLAVARELAMAGGTVIVVLHDLSLAAAWADRICLLSHGRVAATGSPAQVLRAELLSQVYEYPVSVIDHAGSLLVVPQREPYSDATAMAAPDSQEAAWPS